VLEVERVVCRVAVVLVVMRGATFGRLVERPSGRPAP
jgi:hypothetical protein